jgi:hypothetical protein
VPSLPAALMLTLLTGATHVRAQAPLGGDGSEERPFAKISEALAYVADGGEIALEPGLYEEALVLQKPVTISGTGQVVIAAPSGSAVAIAARA